MSHVASVTSLTAPATRALFLVADSKEPCGVEVFTRKLVAALAADEGGCELLPVNGRWRELPSVIARVARAERVVFGLPLVAWKRVLLVPFLLLLAAVVTGRRTVLFLHEWSALHGLRRLVLAPFVMMAGSIVVLSPYVREELAADRLMGGAARKCRLVPHPPTVSAPRERTVTEAVRRVEDAAKTCDLVIGTFGAIYKGKAPDALLDVCAHLRSRGVRAAAVFVGSFTQSLDQYEAQFRGRVAELGLEDRVIVTGYVASEAELYALFERIGVFLFLFPEGMTARRSSVIGCLQSNRPVVVSAPQTREEFAHHPGLTALIDSGALSFVPRSADVAEIAEMLVAAAQRKTVLRDIIDDDAWWKATIAATRAAL
jgi:glycosyltransferase involved in cell wall biosynthesis